MRRRRYQHRRAASRTPRLNWAHGDRVTHELVHYGLALLFLLVAVESAGVPLPGETALIVAALSARDQASSTTSRSSR